MKIVVIGAGISGLAAAFRARQRGADVTLLEASERTGGVIRTLRHDDCILEAGPDCWVSTKPAALELVRELGLEPEVMGTREGTRRAFILHKGKLKRMPEGFFLLAPTGMGPLIRTRTLSLAGKLRMGMELFKRARRDDSDESLADFVRRRFGTEALDRIAQPIIAGIYTADPEKLSLQATFPQLIRMEREHGSLIRALQRRATVHEKAASGARYGLFMTLRDGMQTLPDALASRIGDVRLNTPASAISRDGESLLVSAGDASLRADAVILALPAPASGRLLEGLSPELARGLQEVEYASSAVANFVFERAQVAHALDGTGAVIPAVEKRDLIAVSFSSVKFEGRAPEDKVVLRAFVGGALRPDVELMQPATVAEMALAELRDLLGVTGPALFTDVCFHKSRMAQYHVGHLERVKRLRELEAATPGVRVIGNGFEGIGIPDCIKAANEAVESLNLGAGVA